MSLTADQLAAAIDYLCPGAAYTRYDTYANLSASWTDLTTCPTEAELETAWTTVNKINSITTLNQEYAQKIISKEKYWVATETSSLFTTEEIATLNVSIKADKLAIYQELKTKQEAIING